MVMEEDFFGWSTVRFGWLSSNNKGLLVVYAERDDVTDLQP